MSGEADSVEGVLSPLVLPADWQAHLNRDEACCSVAHGPSRHNELDWRTDAKSRSSDRLHSATAETRQRYATQRPVRPGTAPQARTSKYAKNQCTVCTAILPQLMLFTLQRPWASRKLGSVLTDLMGASISSPPPSKANTLTLSAATVDICLSCSREICPLG
eukprot:scaffold73_cov252-Pinguiococcus_pyrenoidosus.AAC.17